MVSSVAPVRDRADFAALRAAGHRGHDRGLSVRWVPSPDPAATERALAFAVGRQTTNAVGRNRVRRQLRAAFAELSPTCTPGTYLVRVTAAAIGAHYTELRDALAGALSRAGAR